VKIEERFLTMKIFNSYRCRFMCEFDLVINGKNVFRDVVYAKDENGKVTVKDVTGEIREYKNRKIVEVDVNSTRLVLSTLFVPSE
jgi:predicted RNA-binding protein